MGNSAVFLRIVIIEFEGHRENILHGDFSHLGIGVDFNESDQPFYTENFFNN